MILTEKGGVFHVSFFFPVVVIFFFPVIVLLRFKHPVFSVKKLKFSVGWGESAVICCQ